jgi:glucokinase
MDGVVAVDVGGTTVKGALVGPAGAVLARRTGPTPAAGGEAAVAAVLALAGELAGADPAVRVVAVAAVSPGHVADGVVRYAANLGWRDVPLADRLTAALGVPARIDHDARAAALAEAFHSGLQESCLYVVLGTGIGAGHVRAGRVDDGATGAAGELGHIPVYPDGEPCGCGQRGCLEVYASGAGLWRRYRPDGGAEPDGSGERVTARLGHDPAADRVWAEAVEALALALATATLLLDPGAVVLGGGVAGAGATLTTPVVARLAALLAWRAAPPVTLATLGTDAGWLGASRLAWDLVGASSR